MENKNRQGQQQGDINTNESMGQNESTTTGSRQQSGAQQGRTGQQGQDAGQQGQDQRSRTPNR